MRKGERGDGGGGGRQRRREGGERVIRNRREIGTERGEERESSWTLESPEPHKITSGRRERQTKRKTDIQTETDGPPERNVPLQQSMNNSGGHNNPPLKWPQWRGGGDRGEN